jgi:hypothetical protein
MSPNSSQKPNDFLLFVQCQSSSAAQPSTAVLAIEEAPAIVPKEQRASRSVVAMAKMRIEVTPAVPVMPGKDGLDGISFYDPDPGRKIT